MSIPVVLGFNVTVGDVTLDPEFMANGEATLDVSVQPILGMLLFGDPGGDPGGGGLDKIKDVINAALKQKKLGKCLNKIFGPGNILNNGNLPHIDTTHSVAEITQLTGGGAEAGATIQTPVPQTGPGTVSIATEDFYGHDTGPLYLQATYIHETGNILATQRLGNWNARPSPNPAIRGWDHDTGANLEDCVFGGIVQLNGSTTRNP
jgi:hypothetical protein